MAHAFQQTMQDGGDTKVAQSAGQNYQRSPEQVDILEVLNKLL
jgi:hypothetical protein